MSVFPASMNYPKGYFCLYEKEWVDHYKGKELTAQGMGEARNAGWRFVGTVGDVLVFEKV